mmetsp:Transcript_100065/g.173719  ORF Transcript_100065/g.173719 Transcript_100065/m.173719 type:complete len:441 (-) Transcript_100065:14-1336(-)
MPRRFERREHRKPRAIAPPRAQQHESDDSRIVSIDDDIPDRSEDDQDRSEDDQESQKQNAHEDKNILHVTPTPKLYISLLDLSGWYMHAAQSIYLPLNTAPHLTQRHYEKLARWARAVQNLKTPNGMLDIGAAKTHNAPLENLGLCPIGFSLVESAVGELCRKMAERNVHAIQRGKCSKQAQKILLKLTTGSLSISRFEEAEDAATAQLGLQLDGLCRSVAECDEILGSGGRRLLQRARRALREWAKSEGVSFDTLDLEEAYRQVHDRLPDTIAEHLRGRASFMAVASYRAVRADLAHDASGERGEATLSMKLQAAGMSRDAYWDEEDLRNIQMKHFGKVLYPTPDVLLRNGVLINGCRVTHWVDSKGTCLLPEFCFGKQVERLRRQLMLFVQLFGPGLVVWQGGHAPISIQGLQGVHSSSWARDQPGLRFDTENRMRWQ